MKSLLEYLLKKCKSTWNKTINRIKVLLNGPAISIIQYPSGKEIDVSDEVYGYALREGINLTDSLISINNKFKNAVKVINKYEIK